jgi:hypothetical protein
MTTTADAEPTGRAVGARVGAAAVSLWWAVFFFGLIDLSVAVVPSAYDPDFAPLAVLETSWGLLYTILVPVPLIAWAVRPVAWVGPQLLAVATAILATGVAGLTPGQVLVALLVAASAGFAPMWRPRPRWSVRHALATPVFWPLDVLVALGVGGALVHAWHVLDLARGPSEDDNTWGLMHLPMQAGFALAVPAAAAVAVLAVADRVAGWWLAVVPPAVSAVWFGVVSAQHPDLVGSLGEAGGVVAASWGVLVPAAVWVTGAATHPASSSTGERP